MANNLLLRTKISSQRGVLNNNNKKQHTQILDWMHTNIQSKGVLSIKDIWSKKSVKNNG
jgi:hypothetical protein